MRKAGLAVLFLVVLMWGACRSSNSHLSPDELAPVLADLHMADAYSGMLRDTLHPVLGKNYDSLAVWTRSILAKHKLTQEEFNRSMDWYRDRPLELDSLYARVVPLLEHNRK